LKQATTAFISTHITNILSSLIKDHTTVQHIIATLGQQIHVNDQLDHVCDILAPYINLDSMVEEHITANGWKDGEEFAPEGLHFRFNNGGKDKVHTSVNAGHVDSSVYRNHVI
jgi:hypothetical protein